MKPVRAMAVLVVGVWCAAANAAETEPVRPQTAGRAMPDEPLRLTLKFSDYQRSDVLWHAKEEELAKHRAEGRLVGGCGWIEHDFQTPRTGWYELWMASPPKWPHQIWVDGTEILCGTFEEQPQESGLCKVRASGNTRTMEPRRSTLEPRARPTACVPSPPEASPWTGRGGFT
ncbi:MAG: hypothetical protein ABR915_19765 [Thermoguttaceae bacterium]|jgi:hypothetical protein